MRIEICCENFRFVSGKVMLVNWPGDERQPETYLLADGVFDTGDGPLPTGNVRWLLAELTVASGERLIHVPGFPFVAPISAADLARTSIQVQVAPAGLHALTFTSIDGSPRQFTGIAFHEDLSCTIVHTDENGTVNWLGNPFEYYLELDGSTTVTIAPIH
jgi:hypothetical protein